MKTHTNPDGSTREVPHDARVGSGARIGSDARVAESDQIITVLGPLGVACRALTCYRTATGLTVTAGCWSGSIEEMEANLNEPGRHWPDVADEIRTRYVAEYKAVAELLRIRVASWTWDDIPEAERHQTVPNQLAR